MYDKFKLHTREFKVDPNPQLDLWPARIDMRTGDCEEVPLYNDVHGMKATHNCDAFNLTINGYGLKLEFNPSETSTGHNFYTANNTQLDMALKGVHTELEKIGVHCELSECKVTRIDLAKTVELKHSLNQYLPMLWQLPIQKTLAGKQYPSGLNFGNKSQQWCIYDKTLQHKAKHGVSIEKDLGISGNYTRVEHRAMNANKVKGVFGSGNILTYTSRDTYQNCKEVYSKQLEKNVFTLKSCGCEGVDTQGIIAGINTLMKHRNLTLIRALGSYIRTQRVEDILGGFGTIDSFIEALWSSEGVQSKYHGHTNPGVIFSRARKIMKKVLADSWLVQNTTNNLSEGELYTELREKFLRVA